jgi:very-short-patch-repair endonuclease
VKLTTLDSQTRNNWLTNETKLAWLPEYEFCSTRGWRADHACTAIRTIIEVDGGIWIRGRHSRGKGKEADNVKLNTAASFGWWVLRYSTQQFASGQWIDEVAAIVERLDKPF